MDILVTGGAGYIGSHTIRTLKKAGYEVIVYDNLSRGHSKAVDGFRLIEGDISEKSKLQRVFNEHDIKAVMHFAAHSQVGESVENPALYYKNNVIGGLTLLEAVIDANINYFIFSSTAAVYGEPETVPITEKQIIKPTNPYGESKAVLEKALMHYGHSYGLRTISLRYFNAAGADLNSEIGEDHEPETHLIPLVLQAVLGLREKIIVFGDDYPTADGTAVRDYIHVLDLAEAHVLALNALLNGATSSIYNLGNGKGYSVLDVINTVEEVVVSSVPYEIGSRRPGDPAVLVASSGKALSELKWQPKYSNLDQIITTAWSWHKANPYGFK